MLHGQQRPTVPRTEQQAAAEKAEIEKYRALVAQVESRLAARDYSSEAFGLTSKLLTKNPEYYTIWNARRLMLTSGIFSTSSDSSLPSTESLNTLATSEPKTSSDVSSSSGVNSSKDSNRIQPDQDHLKTGKNGTTHDAITRDLSFVVPLLKSWPKCYWIWNHRIWLLNQAVERLDVKVARKLWEGELALVSMMLVRDSRNFHGWGYRKMIVEQLESETLEGTSMVEPEFAYTTKMVTAHLSNFSAWHYRSLLIPRLLDERQADDSARREFLDQEFDTMREALWTDSYDQSLWFYYQFLMSNLVDYVGRTSIVPSFTIEDRTECISKQLVELRDLLDGAEDCKWIYNALFDYTLAIAALEARQTRPEEKVDLNLWLTELRKLDSLRNGKWDEIEKSLRSKS